MQIDWLTVAAQIVNFLILVWLLQRFLYKPIVTAMQRREQRIADRLAEAARHRQEAEAEAARYRDQQNTLARERERLMTEARDAAEAERKSLEQEARQAVDAKRQHWLSQLEAQQDAFLDDLRQRTADQFHALARQALADLADAGLEEQMATTFARRIETLPDADRQAVAAHCARADGGITVTSRFELTAEAKRRLTKALHHVFGESVTPTYGHDPDQLAGLELRVGSQALRWGFASYLDGYQAAVAERLTSRLSAHRDGATL